MSTLKTTNIQHASAASAAITLASDGTAAATLSSLNGGPLSGARNRIINGDMRIDQRNAGASVTGNDGVYSVDRWFSVVQQPSKFTMQQNAGAVTPPARFQNYLGITSSSAYSVATGDFFQIRQRIEGFNVSDLAWGTANAQAVTLSFWVRSSLTGTFGGSANNNSADRSYPFSYTINSANTWEYKTITIAGETSGTWLTTNGVGFQIGFSLGAGATYSGTAGAWSSSALVSPTGATSVVGTNGATFYITGVQLEAGTVATPFERRSYGQELALCQRYYESGNYYFNSSTTVAGVTAGTSYQVQKRAQPTITVTASTNVSSSGTGTTVASSGSTPQCTTQLISFFNNTGSAGAYSIGAVWTSSAEL